MIRIVCTWHRKMPSKLNRCRRNKRIHTLCLSIDSHWIRWRQFGTANGSNLPKVFNEWHARVLMMKLREWVIRPHLCFGFQWNHLTTDGNQMESRFFFCVQLCDCLASWRMLSGSDWTVVVSNIMAFHTSFAFLVYSMLSVDLFPIHFSYTAFTFGYIPWTLNMCQLYECALKQYNRWRRILFAKSTSDNIDLKVGISWTD